MTKNTICLWYDHDAEEAARFYARTFSDSKVSAVYRAPSDYPGGKAGDVLTVGFTVCGVSCLGLNGGDGFKHSEAFSFQIATDDQAETDRYWNAIVDNDGVPSACDLCKDKWGLSWRRLTASVNQLPARTGAPDRCDARRGCARSKLTVTHLRSMKCLFTKFSPIFEPETPRMRSLSTNSLSAQPRISA